MTEIQLSFPDPSREKPGLAWRDGPDTTTAAAIHAAPAAATQRGRVLVLIHDAGDDGLTALEAEALMLLEFPRMRNVRPRITELRRDGWLLPYNERTRLTDSGAEAHINLFNPDAEGDYSRFLERERVMAYSLEKFVDDVGFVCLVAWVTLIALMVLVVLVMFALALWG